MRRRSGRSRPDQLTPSRGQPKQPRPAAVLEQIDCAVRALTDPAENPASGDILTRVHTGTPDYAAQLTVPAALAFQSAIGGAWRERRLRALRDRWVRQVVGLPQVQILTPEVPGMYGAITAFRLRGRTSHDDNVALAKMLLDRHRIFTVHRDGIALGSCVRVTPALATRMSDCDALAAAIRSLAT